MEIPHKLIFQEIDSRVKFIVNDLPDHNGLQLILSHDGQGGSLTVHQDMTLHQIRLQPDQQTDYAPAPNRTLYVHIITGELQVHNVLLSAGDSATIKLDEGQCNINFQALQNTEALLFDLA